MKKILHVMQLTGIHLATKIWGRSVINKWQHAKFLARYIFPLHIPSVVLEKKTSENHSDGETPLITRSCMCGKMYSTVVRHLYRICKCETMWAYLQNFFKSPCMEYFQCKDGGTLFRRPRDIWGKIVPISQDASSYNNIIDIIILGSHCNEVHRIYVSRTIILSSSKFFLNIWDLFLL